MDHLHDCPQTACPDVNCRSVFDRVVVSYLVPGGTRVLFELLDTFTDPPPLIFQLQVGTTNNPKADDWEDVGLPVENQYFALDPEQRVWGMSNWTHYRVKLTTPLGRYVSDPVGGQGVLDRRSWRLGQEIIRQRRVAYRMGPGGQEGYLLKRRVTGQRCPVCLDPQTQEVLNPGCPECFGVGFVCGYYYPMACVWAELSPKTTHVQIDGQMRGLVNDVVVKAEMLAVELMSENDVWVAKKTDERYYVHSVTHTAEMRGQPLVAQVELRAVPFSSHIYGIAIPEQLRDDRESGDEPCHTCPE